MIICILVFIILLYMMFPYYKGKNVCTSLMGYYYAHRGFHDLESPENSLSAFQKAVKNGYGIELDVQLTSDNQLVVFHDETIDRMTLGTGCIKDYTYQQLCQYTLDQSIETIPLLKDVLQLVDGQVPLIIEIKSYNRLNQTASITNQLVTNYNGVYCIESFHPSIVKWFKDHAPTVIRGQLGATLKGSKCSLFTKFMARNMLLNFLTKPHFIAYGHLDHNCFALKYCRGVAKSCCVAWTLKDQQQLSKVEKEFDLFIFENFKP